MGAALTKMLTARTEMPSALAEMLTNAGEMPGNAAEMLAAIPEMDVAWTEMVGTGSAKSAAGMEMPLTGSGMPLTGTEMSLTNTMTIFNFARMKKVLFLLAIIIAYGVMATAQPARKQFACEKREGDNLSAVLSAIAVAKAEAQKSKVGLAQARALWE